MHNQITRHSWRAAMLALSMVHLAGAFVSTALAGGSLIPLGRLPGAELGALI